MSLVALGCGGGQVDRGFYGEYEVAPPAAQSAARPRATPLPSSRVKFDRPKVVIIRAAWCGICKEVEPSLLAAYEPYKGKIDLLVLDVTDEASVAASHGRAEDEGVREFFMKYGARTPTVGVFIGADNGRLVHGELKDPDVLKRELDHALTHFQP